MAAILQGGVRDTINTSQFAVTNITEDYALDCNANADLATADVLGTLIRELIRKGVINGTVA
jgi:hypothetical protein